MLLYNTFQFHTNNNTTNNSLLLLFSLNIHNYYIYCFTNITFLNRITDFFLVSWRVQRSSLKHNGRETYQITPSHSEASPWKYDKIKLCLGNIYTYWVEHRLEAIFQQAWIFKPKDSFGFKVQLFIGSNYSRRSR